MIDVRLNGVKTPVKGASQSVVSMQKKLAKVREKLPEIGTAITTEGVELIQFNAMKNIRSADLLFRRELLSSFQTSVKTEGTGGAVLARGRVWSESVHAPVMEYGRRAGKFPPIDAIAQWVSEKITGTSVSGPRREKTAASIRSIAFVIARSIAKKGAPKRARGGVKFLSQARDTAERMLPKIADRVIAEFKRDHWDK